jgi:adhesin transport system outer membrane protein
MMKIGQFGIALAIALAGAQAQGQAQAQAPSALPTPRSEASQVLSLGDALDLAAIGHPSVRVRLSERTGAQARLDAARWQRYPQLSVQAAAGTSGSQETALVAQVPVWVAGRIDAEVDAASSRVGATLAAVEGAQLAIMETVLAAFGDLSRLKDRAVAASASLDQHARLAALIERRVAAEVSSQADLTLARGRLAQAQGELRQIEAQIVASRSGLEQAVGRAVPDIAPMQVRSLLFRDVDAAVTAAREASPELRRLQREIDAAQRDVQARRAARYPQVVARLRYDLGSGGGSSHQAQLGLDYQTGPGFAAAAAVREAEARVETLRQEYQAQAQRLAERARTDWTTARVLEQQVQDLQLALRSTREFAESTDRQYVIGRKSWIEVLNAYREVAQTAQSVADAYWGEQAAVHRLHLLTGLLGSAAATAAPVGR